MKKVIYFGWRKGNPDPRDRQFKAAIAPPEELESVDLRKSLKLPPVMNQGATGSCTGHGVGALLHFDMLNNRRGIYFTPSPSFLYYNGRVEEGSENQDCGAVIRDVVKMASVYGFCDVSHWPVNPSIITKRPTQEVYDSALKTRSLTYYALDNTDKAALCNALYNAFPFTFGITVFESFEGSEVAKTGKIPMPNYATESCLGGHCMYCFGYDATTDEFLIANSWGVDWGDNGYARIPAAYLTNPNLAADFWTINTLAK